MKHERAIDRTDRANGLPAKQHFPLNWPKPSAGRLFLQILCRFTERWILERPRSVPEEMEGIPHYLVDVLEPDDPFNVVVFQQMAKAR